MLANPKKIKVQHSRHKSYMVLKQLRKQYTQCMNTGYKEKENVNWKSKTCSTCCWYNLYQNWNICTPSGYRRWASTTLMLMNIVLQKCRIKSILKTTQRKVSLHYTRIEYVTVPKYIDSNRTFTVHLREQKLVSE